MILLIIIVIIISLLTGIIVGLWLKRWDKTDGYWDGWFAHGRCIREEYWRYKNIYTIAIETPKLITMANCKNMTEEEQMEYELHTNGG